MDQFLQIYNLRKLIQEVDHPNRHTSIIEIKSGRDVARGGGGGQSGWKGKMYAYGQFVLRYGENHHDILIILQLKYILKIINNLPKQ